MSTLPRAVLFDLDGTLVDSLQDLTEATNRLRESYALPASSPEEVRGRIGRGARNLVALSVGEKVPVEAALARFYKHYTAVMTDRTQPFPGVVSILDNLGARGVIRGVATNKPSAFTDPILERLGFSARLEGWASADESERKPDPATLHLALSRSGAPDLDPATVVYVGDMPVDVAAARNFGARVVGVGWGLDPEGLAAANPDAMVDSPHGLSEALGLPVL